ncbi:MAG: hypothetical protein IAE97_10955 [Chthoniobacterales bacterium]|nr:hypothetical protein [Chthoniobacterales bacterium]
MAISLAVVLGVALFLMITEVFVIIGFVALPLLAMRFGNRYWIVISGLVAVMGLVLHFSGFKLYGSAQVVTTPPLPNARKLVSLQPPNQLRFSNGDTLSLADIYIPTSVDLSELSGRSEAVANDMRVFKLLRALGFNQGTNTISVQVDPQGHALAQRRMNYWCGNTFFPTLLPRRLPSHDTVDLGLKLVAAGLAIPSDVAGEDKDYRKTLLQALSDSQDSPWYCVTAKIPQLDRTTVALGRSLAKSDSRDFVAGAYLLVAAQDTESYATLRREILRRMEINGRDYDAVAQARSEDFGNILAWIDVDEARRQLLPISFQTRSFGPTWPDAAMTLACHGDLQGFDAVVQRMANPSTSDSERSSLSRTLKSFFRFPENLPSFLEWYQRNRPRLRSGRDHSGQLAFWLDEGQPFDSAYFSSMQGPAVPVP